MVEELNNFNSHRTHSFISLHFSQIISLKHSDLMQLQISAIEVTNDEADLNKLIFCGTIPSVDRSLWDFYQNEWQKTPILVINYWNVEYKFIQTIIVRGRLKEINKIIDSYNAAKQNYENNIPNIPDDKGDRKIMKKYLFIAILSFALIVGIIILVIMALK